ncbi:hypothetical protein BD310DRAFT_931110 [Dichomitus squalens]|uniref:Uncharacterized protein n=1 Tax=Dichomitus squalens TaxID=114155 RepID=A0A4Q9PQM1_9APHY|nr:hypothetical protein BD310DRAFT_931110 [Dichomitus squalens]
MRQAWQALRRPTTSAHVAPTTGHFGDPGHGLRMVRLVLGRHKTSRHDSSREVSRPGLRYNVTGGISSPRLPRRT